MVNQEDKVTVLKNKSDQKIGYWIKFFRQARGLRQSELAAFIGLSRVSMVNIEAGKQSITVDRLLKLCAVLGCKPNELLPEPPKFKVKVSNNSLTINWY